MTYGKKVFIGIDQLINTLIGGWPDETLSSVSWRWYRDGKRKWPKILIDGLFFWQKDHCYESYLSEQRRTQLAPEFRPNTYEM